MGQMGEWLAEQHIVKSFFLFVIQVRVGGIIKILPEQIMQKIINQKNES